jgi:hypothetical protein
MYYYETSELSEIAIGIGLGRMAQVKASLGYFIAPKGAEEFQPGFNPGLYTQIGETRIPGKRRLMVRQYRLEAYATLFSGVSSDVSRTSWRYLREPTATTPRRKVA